jgi:hypothetical protein
VCTPRQVTAGVSPAIDEVVCRALLQRGGRHGAPITSPGEFADALAGVAPPVPLPEPAPPGTLEPPRYPDHDGYGGYQGGYPPNPDDHSNWALPERGRGGAAPYQGPYPPQGPPGRGPRDGRGGNGRGGASRVAVTVVVVLVIAALVTTALVISNSLRNSGSGKAGGTPSTKPSSSAPASAAVLTPAGVSTFNIFGKPAGNTEDPSSAGQAIDGSLSTAWATSYYLGSPVFGGLKTGTGLLLDMGKAVKLSQVEVLFGSQCCTSAEIYIGNSNAMSQTALDNFTKVAPSVTVSRSHTFTVNSSATGRYVLIWITSLPPMQGSAGKYQALIYNIVVRGTAPGAG